MGPVAARRSFACGAVAAGLLMGIGLAYLSTPLLEAVGGNGTTAAWHLAMDDANLFTHGGREQ